MDILTFLCKDSRFHPLGCLHHLLIALMRRQLLNNNYIFLVHCRYEVFRFRTAVHAHALQRCIHFFPAALYDKDHPPHFCRNMQFFGTVIYIHQQQIIQQQIFNKVIFVKPLFVRCQKT